METSWKQLESSKRRFERDCKEAEKAQQAFDKMDTDTLAKDVEKRCSLKARQQAQVKQQAVEESRADYLAFLKNFNKEQNQHYYTLLPHIYQRIQVMEQTRIERLRDSMLVFAEVERAVLPPLGRCLDAMTQAAQSIQPPADERQVVESFKSGFDPPGDVEVEDYGAGVRAAVRRSVSESSFLDREERRRGSRGKLWPFIRRNKLMSLLASPRQPPPPPPTSPSPGGAVADGDQSPQQPKEPLSHRLNEIMTSMTSRHKMLKRGLSLKLGSGPEQRRKKLQAKITDLNKDIQKELDQRDALTKMKDVYLKNPHMGDARSLQPRLEEITQTLEHLQNQARKYQTWLCEMEAGLGDPNRRQSGGTMVTTPGNNCAPVNRESPDGSYTEDHSVEQQFKSSRSAEFDDDFDDEEEELPLPTIGTCTSLYPFTGQNEGTISLAEGEVLFVIEEDKGDGWTRVRRSEEEEGYVPTSYISVFYDLAAAATTGAMTYI